MKAGYDSLMDNRTWTLVNEPQNKHLKNRFKEWNTEPILLATAAHKDLYLDQMDVKLAYLHSKIEEEVYLEQPEGFHLESKFRTKDGM